MERPKPTVAVIIENEKNEILLEKRNIEPYKGYWCLPGGHIEFGERAIDAAKREIKEETYLSIEPEFLFYQDEIIPRINWHCLALVFYSKVKGAKPKPQREEVKELKWYKLKDAFELNLAFKHKEILERYKKFRGQ